MQGPLCLICVSLIVLTVVPCFLCQTNDPGTDNSRERSVVPGISEAITVVPKMPEVRLRGLCRDGWSKGTMTDFSGKEIPICVKVTQEALSWSEAQTTCRKDYGFLLKLESKATVNGIDLLPSIAAKGISNFWTGMQTEHRHLVWDDLIPNQVRPHNSYNSSMGPERPWTWENSLTVNQLNYCGLMNLVVDDDVTDDNDINRRRKRSSDDDNSDNSFPGFDFSSLMNSNLRNMANLGGRNNVDMRNNPPLNRNSAFNTANNPLRPPPAAFRPSSNKPLAQNNAFRPSNKPLPRTSAFQTLLSRTQISDQLDGLPDSLGMQSAPQLPGTGIPDANIQNGGLATNIPMTEQSNNFDSDSDIPSIESSLGESQNSDSTEKLGVNPSDLLSAVRDAAEAVGAELRETVPTPTPTEAVETLRNLIKENLDNLNADAVDSNSDLNSKDSSDFLKTVDEGKVEVTIPTITADDLNLKEPDGFSQLGNGIVNAVTTIATPPFGKVKAENFNDNSGTSDENSNLIANLETISKVFKDDDKSETEVFQNVPKVGMETADGRSKEPKAAEVPGSNDDRLNGIFLSTPKTDDVSESDDNDKKSVSDLNDNYESFGQTIDNIKEFKPETDKLDDSTIGAAEKNVDFEKFDDNNKPPEIREQITEKAFDNLAEVSEKIDDVAEIASESVALPDDKEDQTDNRQELLSQADLSIDSSDKLDFIDDSEELRNTGTEKIKPVLDDRTEKPSYEDINSNDKDLHENDFSDLLDKEIESVDFGENATVSEQNDTGETVLEDGQTKRDSDWSDWNDGNLNYFEELPETGTNSGELDDVLESNADPTEIKDSDFEANNKIISGIETPNTEELEFPDLPENNSNEMFEDSQDLFETMDKFDNLETEKEETSPIPQQIVDGEFSDVNDDRTEDIVKEVEQVDDHDNDSLDTNTDRSGNTEIDLPESGPEDTDDRISLDDVPDLAENVVEEDLVSAIGLDLERKEMKLSSCEVRLPSVCFSYEVEVMDKASTCEEGWYGHVLLDTCYKILDKKMNYMEAVDVCRSHNARLIMSGSEFERTFVLTAVQKQGNLFRGARFWLESPSDKRDCRCFDETGVQTMPDCKASLNVVCIKDAQTLSVYTTDNTPHASGDMVTYYQETGEDIVFQSRDTDNTLYCDLTSGASEFPVLWFKDGVLVDTKDKYVSSDLSLHLDSGLVSAIGTVTDRELATPALQGRYWCEVWDRQTLTRKSSRAFNVRFSDVITFHGTMELPPFSHQQEVLFNMMGRKFPLLSSAEMDIRKVFKDALPNLQLNLPFVEDVFTYVDSIRSNPYVVEYHTYFTLNRDFTIQDEDVLYSRLKAVLRAQLGNRNYMIDLPGHTSLASFRTMSLHSTVSCPAATLQTTKDIYGHVIPAKVFSFPKALLGEFANSLDNCSLTNKLPSGTARCLGDFYTGAYWGEVVANECIEEAELDQLNNEIWGHSAYTDKLTQIAKTTVDAKNVDKLVSEVAQIAKAAPKFTPTDINKIADVLDHTTQIQNLNPKVGEDVLKTVDRLMGVSGKEAHVANVETKAANRIIKSLERFAENADLGANEQIRIVSDNVVVEIWNLKPTAQPVIGLAAESRDRSVDTPFKAENIATVYNKSQLYEANVDAAIELPKEVFSMKEKGTSVSSRLTMMVFRKSKLFEAAITDDGRRMNPTEQQLSNLNSYIISASIAGKKLEDLGERVKTIFKPIQTSEGERSCVWWDFDMNNFKGGWSNKGCVYDGRINGRDVCLCNHLTNFAVLIDFYGQAKPIPDHHELTLSIITVIGLSFSILGLSLTIISYMFFRKLRQGRAQQTLFNLSLSLLLSMLVFLVGVKQTHNYYGCLVVAILLHYLILVSFMWMLMEAVLQYLTFVKILGTYITRFTLKTVLPAWGLPLIPVLTVLSVDYTLYKGGPYYCWMGLDAFYYAFAIPVTCIIIINVIIFIVTIVSIFRRGKGLRSNQKKHKMAVTNLQAAITSFVLLGLTWIFGYLAISDARLLFQYVFTILNSLQGFFIFVLFVLRKKKVREQWYFICCKGIEKDRVSRSLSASNSIPSTYSNGSRKEGRERDRSDSTKTVQSTYSNSSNGFTNYGYDHGYDYPFSRYDRRAFRKF